MRQVKGNKELFTQRYFQDDKSVCKLARVLFIPIGRTMEKISDRHWIWNSPVTRTSLVVANKIFGSNLNVIKGKTVSLNTPEVRINISNVPISIMSLYRNATLAEDILYVNKIAFLASISAGIKFITLKCILNHRDSTLEVAFNQIKKVYALQGSTLSSADMDNEF